MPKSKSIFDSAIENGLSRRRATLLIIGAATVNVFWGLLFSIQPPFYSSEAEKKGATPAQYGFVFGIIHLAAFISAPIFGRLGPKLGPKLVYNVGGIAQGVVGILFGFLEYVDNVAIFLGLSYLLRFLDGVADAAAWTALLGLLVQLWPERAAQIISWGETTFGFGYTVGPAIGSLFYIIGGFKLPFIVVGTLGILTSVSLYFLVPSKRKRDSHDRENERRKPFTLSTVFSVRIF